MASLRLTAPVEDRHDQRDGVGLLFVFIQMSIMSVKCETLS